MSTTPRFRVLIIGPVDRKVRVQALAEGVEAHGGAVVAIPDNKLSAIRAALAAGPVPVTFAITCGMHGREAVARGFLAGAGIPLLVLDLGYFRRATGAKDAEGYNQLGLGRLGWVPLVSCSERADRFEGHGLTVSEPVQGRRKAALILGQKPRDSQHGLDEAQLGEWLGEQAARLLAQGYDLRFRPHPKAPDMRLDVLTDRSPVGRPLADDLADVALAVTYNSTAGLEALMAGVPVVCHPSAHYAHVADLADRPALLAHLHRLAWSQWTCEELRNGGALEFMNRFAPILPRE